MDLDVECLYEARNEEIEFGCESINLIEPAMILDFRPCISASAKTIFFEECGWVCKHGRPVSRCVYTIDPLGYFDLGDDLDGCYLESQCVCTGLSDDTCNYEARMVQC